MNNNIFQTLAPVENIELECNNALNKETCTKKSMAPEVIITDNIGENTMMNKDDPKIWFKDPKILYVNENWKIFFPNKNMNTIEILNAFMRFSIYFFIITSLINFSINSIFVPLFMALFTFFIYKFHEEKLLHKIENYPINNTLENRTLPTAHNPFMNTLLSDVGINKSRDIAANIENENIKKQIEYQFNKNLHKEVNDIYNKRNSQNRFFTMPNTNEYGVRNGDTIAFANWLYNKPVPTCKEDNQFCINNYSNLFDNHRNLRSKRKLAVPCTLYQDFNENCDSTCSQTCYTNCSSV